MMKKLFILAFVSILILNCQSAQSYMGDLISKTYIGMGESEFKELSTEEQLIYMDSNHTIYKIRRTAGKGTAHKFFYFTENKLIRIDEGEQVADFKIEVKK